MGNKLSKKNKATSAPAAAATTTTTAATTGTAPATAAPAGPPPVPSAKAGVLEKIIKKQGKYKIISSMGGSCECQKVQEKSTGKLYIVKLRKSKDQCINEMRANKLYTALGASIPETEIHTDPSTGCTLTTQEYIDGTTLKDLFESKNQHEITKATEAVGNHYLIDCLLSNWDVVGGRGGDNIIITADGKAYRIDNAGVFGIRAQGEPRPSWGKEQIVSELYVMRDPEGNKQAAAVFQHISDHEVAHQFIALKNLLSTGFLENEVFESEDHPDLRIVKSRIEWVEQFLQQSAPEVLLDPASLAGEESVIQAQSQKQFSPRTAEEKLSYLVDLGFNIEAAEVALLAADGNVQSAIDILYANTNERAEEPELLD
eukprot:TRINITY_DN308_c2_g1_i1.p1 TRINITY_DN308_c2_g1~~TRINITY_DN308_c2_g1_i1.p1  ORF type:complete len:372 (+),score=70.84 TRINITY_DN308_c2_g1_i1:64-1179(+)